MIEMQFKYNKMLLVNGIVFILTNVCVHMNAFMVKTMFQPLSFSQIWDCCSCLVLGQGLS